MKRRWTSRRCCRILAIICFVTFGYRANAETSMKLPQSFYGYYVYASEKNDGLNCNKNEPTPIEQLERSPENPEDHIGFQMTVTASKIRYNGIGTHVSCEIRRVYRPKTKGAAPGLEFAGSWLRPFDPVYILDQTCFDEGTRSQGSVMFRLIRLGSSIVLLETDRKSSVTEAWAKCQKE
jgi:hypothetical protein